MRILQVVASLAPRYGGPSVACPALCRALVRRGLEASIYTTNVDGPTHLDVPLDRPVMQGGVEIRYFPGWTRPLEYKISLALWRALDADIPFFDAVHIWSMYIFSATIAGHLCRKYGVPYILQPHGTLDPYLRKRHRFRKALYSLVVERRNFRNSSCVLFNSPEEERLAENWVDATAGERGSPPRKVVVPVGVDQEWLDEANPAATVLLRQRFPELAGRRIVLFFGRLSFKKGLDILAGAFARVARQRGDVHLVVAGPDSEGYGRRTRRWLNKEGVVERATFTGPLFGEDRIAMMRAADVFVLPSYSENFGQAATEAMAAGVPLVISDRVNIWPEVKSAGAGLVVPCRPQETADGILTILDSPDLAREMAERGRCLIEQKLTWEKVADQMALVYQEMASRKPKPFYFSKLQPPEPGAPLPVKRGRAVAEAPLKILHVIPSLAPGYGGPSKACLELCRELVNQGHHVSIYTTNVDTRGRLPVPLSTPVLHHGVQIRFFPAYRLHEYKLSASLAVALRRDLPAFDVVHCHSVYSFAPTVAAYYCRKYKIPYLVRPHGSFDPFLFHRHRIRKSIYENCIEWRNLKGASAIHFTSDDERALTAPLGFSTPAVVVPHGIFLQEYDRLPEPGAFRATQPETAGRKIILFLNRIHFKKGLDILIPAFARLLKQRDDLCLVLAGPDPGGYRRRVERWILQAGISRACIWTGMLSGEIKLAALRDADVFVLPSYTENFGIAVVEAMAAGVPVLISDKVNICRGIQQAEAGLVVGCNPEEIARGLATILDNSGYVRQMVRRARLLVEEKYTWGRVAKEMIEVYSEIVANGRRAAVAATP